MHVARLRTRREGDGQAQLAVLDRKGGLRPQRARQMGAPAIEARARCRHDLTVTDRQFQRQVAAFGHAHLVGAGQPLRRRLHRQARAGCHASRDLQVRQYRIGAFVNMVHQARDQQRFGHWIAQGADGHALGQSPVHGHAQARVAGIFPIAVPAPFGHHRKGDGRALARLWHRAFRHQRGGDMRRTAAEGALRRCSGSMGGGQACQQGKRHEYDLKNPHRASGRSGARGLGRSPSAVKA